MRRLQLTETGYAFPLQLWPQAIRAGFRITEIPVRLIYNDPTRSFGGVLDDASRRLQHYLDVFHTEMAKPLPFPSQEEAGATATGAGACVPCTCCG
jgi:dolichol-phosphate mannosyltransferase